MARAPKLIVGNWKMNGFGASLHEVRRMLDALAAQPSPHRIVLCPPAVLLHRIAEVCAGSQIEVGAQDVHHERPGARTGDHAAEMLHDAGARLVIIGHSERRTDHREADGDVAAKVQAALRAGLEPIVCVGERQAERAAGEAIRVVRSQIEGSLPMSLDGQAFAVAYEPVWAIGSGLTPTLAEIEAMHAEIRQALSDRFPRGGASPVLYGGSVKPVNAREILATAGVGGVLVGGASLTASDFLPIVRSADQAAS